MTQKAVPEWDGDVRKHLCEEAVALSKTHTRYSSKERFNELYLVWFFLMQQLLRYFWGCLELLLCLLKIKCTDFHQRTDSQRQSPFAAVALRNHSGAAERNAAYYKPFMCFFSDAPKDRYTTGTIQYNGRRE